MSLEPPTRFNDWQSRRRKLCHNELKNGILHLILAIDHPDDASALLNRSEWLDRLRHWDDCLEGAASLTQESAAALSPSKFLESEAWLALPSSERERYGHALHDEWWKQRKMDEKICNALGAITLAQQALRLCLAEADKSDQPSSELVRLLQKLGGDIRSVQARLKDFDFGPIWE